MNRESFEAWYQKAYACFGQANFHLNSYGEYVDDDIEASWCAWQAALASQAHQTTLLKHQPCGCVICTCENETQCQGCGAKNCGTHAVGKIPHPVYLQSQAQQPDAFSSGVAYACARLVEIFDQTTMAEEIMQQSGADFSNIDEADSKFLKGIL